MAALDAGLSRCKAELVHFDEAAICVCLCINYFLEWVREECEMNIKVFEKLITCWRPENVEKKLVYENYLVMVLRFLRPRKKVPSRLVLKCWESGNRRHCLLAL